MDEDRKRPGESVSAEPDGHKARVEEVVPPDEVSTEALRKAESYIEAEEGATNRLSGWAGTVTSAILVVMTAFHLYAAYDIVPTQELRYIHAPGAWRADIPFAEIGRAWAVG